MQRQQQCGHKVSSVLEENAAFTARVKPATKRVEGVKGVECHKSRGPEIYLHSLQATTDFKSWALEELQGDGLFLLTTVFYIQTNERTGRKIMRDGKGEREWSEKERSWSHERETETVKEG